MMTFTYDELLKAGRSLIDAPGANPEYERGIYELLGRAILDMRGVGEGTGENAIIVQHDVQMMGFCERASQK